MDRFIMNNYIWTVQFVPPNSSYLIDRTGKLTVATTDPSTLTVYVSETLQGDFLKKVVLHELGHCALFSFGLLNDIHRLVKPKYWIDVEEWFCNVICEYGQIIFDTAYSLYGNHAWKVVPEKLERLIV